MRLCTKPKNPVLANEVQEEGRGSKPPSGSHRPATPAEIRLEPQQLFESVVGFANGGQF